MKKFIINLFIIIFSILASFILIELGTRIFWSDSFIYNSQDSIIYSKNSPCYIDELSKYKIVGGDIGYIRNPENSDYNKYGVFGSDIPIRKTPGTYRILVLGDSVTFDATILPDGFTKVMSRRLNDHFKTDKIIVMNTGVEGWNTYQEELYLEQYGVKLDPDMIVLAFNNSDFGVIWERVLDNKKLTIRQREKKRIPLIVDFGSYNNFILEHFYSIRLFFIRIDEFLKRINKKDYKIFSYYFEDAENETALNKINSIAKSLKVPLVIVHFPDLDNFSDYQNSPNFFRHKLMKDYSAKNSINYLDLLEYFKKKPADSLRLVPGDDIHPNNAGNIIAGNAISDFIISNNLISIK